MSPRLVIAALLLSPLPAAANGFIALDLPGSQLTALADDGRSAAGSVIGSASGGFRWQQGQGARLLPDAVSVHGISPNGRYVVGSSLDRNAREVATWWSADDVVHAIADAPGIDYAIGDSGKLRDLADAAVEPAPCSSSVTPESSDDLPQPFEFTATSRDGALRVGHAGSGGQRRAIVWTAHGGAQRLDVFLAAHGIEVPRDWILVAATAVAPQARRIGGYGLHQHRFDSFIAELPASVRILCDSSIPPAASQRRKFIQEIKP